MKSIVKMLGVAFLGSVLAAPSLMAQTVDIDYDHSINFLKYQTYTLDKVHATDPLVEQRIIVALNRDLGFKYMHQVPKGSDVTITVVEASTDKQEYPAFYDGLGKLDWKRGWGAGGFLDSSPTVDSVTPGTLIIDMYDTKTQKLVWRGVVTEPVTNSSTKNDQEMDNGVDKLFGKFPPKFEKKK
jgi:hypothetical protein